MVKSLPAQQEIWVQSLGQEDPLEERMAAHCCILAWRVPRTEGPGGPRPVGLRRERHDEHASGTVAARTNYLTFDDLNTNASPYSLVGRKPVLHESCWLKIKARQGCVLLEAPGESLLDFPASRTPRSPLSCGFNSARSVTSVSHRPLSATQKASLLLKPPVIRFCPPG